MAAPGSLWHTVTETAQAAKGLGESEWLSPVFADIIAKMTLAADLEVERLLGLGLPIIVDRGNGVEELSARPSR